MSWASHRQSQYVGGVIAIIAVAVFFLLIYPLITRAPSCSDAKQDGTETGIDCGGVCAVMCSNTVSNPIVLWSRAFPVTGHVYNLAAFIENQNKNSAVESASYEFTIYDSNNKLLGRRAGTTFIPANQDLAIFEPRFDAGQATVHSVSFSFTSPLVWVKKAPTVETLPIHVTDVLMGTDVNSPTLTATINNDSIYDLPEFDVIAILYDADHNVINVSKTHKDSLSSNSNALLLFTWPQVLSSVPVTEDVLPQINPFTTAF